MNPVLALLREARMYSRGSVLVLLVALLAAAGSVFADVPGTMHVQGRLTDDTGVPVQKNFAGTFKIFEAAAGGSEVWPKVTGQEMQVVSTDSLGVWNAVIGQSYPIPAAIFSDTSLWLEITFDDHSNPPVTFPRTKLHTGPFSFQAARSQTADSAFTLRTNTVGSSHIIDGTIKLADLGSNGASIGDVMKWSGAHWIVTPDETGAVGDFVSKAGDVMSGALGFDPDGTGEMILLHATSSGYPQIIMTSPDSAQVRLTPRLSGTNDPDFYLENEQGHSSHLSVGSTQGGRLTFSKDLSACVDLAALSASYGGAYLILKDSTKAKAIVLAPGLTGTNTVQLPDGAISGNEIANGSVSFADLGQNGASPGEVIKWNGSYWDAAPDEAGSGDYVLTTGDVMTGNLSLEGSSPGQDVILRSTGTTEHGELAVFRGDSNSIYLDASNSAGHPTLQIMEASELRASLATVERGGYLYLYDSSATPTFTASALGISTGGAYMKLEDSSGTKSIVLTPGASSGNATASFPNDAIARDEIWDEPGVAQDIDSLSTTMLSGTGHEIMSRTIDCPRGGFVMVMATAEVNLPHFNGTATTVELGVSDVSGILSSEQKRRVTFSSAMPTGSYTQIVQVQKIFSVDGVGPRTFYFIGSKISGVSNPSTDHVTLSLVYFPTAYGSVTE